MDAEPLQARCGCLIALIDSDVDAGLLQSLCKTKAANAPADNRYVKCIATHFFAPVRLECFLLLLERIHVSVTRSISPILSPPVMAMPEKMDIKMASNSCGGMSVRKMPLAIPSSTICSSPCRQ